MHAHLAHWGCSGGMSSGIALLLILNEMESVRNDPISMLLQAGKRGLKPTTPSPSTVAPLARASILTNSHLPFAGMTITLMGPARSTYPEPPRRWKSRVPTQWLPAAPQTPPEKASAIAGLQLKLRWLLANDGGKFGAQLSKPRAHWITAIVVCTKPTKPASVKSPPVLTLTMLVARNEGARAGS
ncbi:hypothetical protein VOLCADRAFT_103153 [Volvox carteri f. nagariensis]|uniref:FAE domain-containing protein n=1 Tax=Volvox carteri f. nagariensis TaxID=3068 RepID=D8TJV2_VOLCA|nr:uncharacterized protein VOLCADRAFT_103153 [Volvox carteri f. nagariensis]EFJ52135.1 hypothetical protein VOLCADRAFT_103153 [Volvox carteri f. nagariensis]|eukprot:XP_002946909.1 hypothetical protein VOLCADRAFT_103153 [Volvox carteri f. nagariensis]